jgi:hypothetical protein
MKETLIQWALGGLLGFVLAVIIFGVNYLRTGYVI